MLLKGIGSKWTHGRKTTVSEHCLLRASYPSIFGHQLSLIDVDLTKTKIEVRNGGGQDRALGPVQSERCCRNHT